MDIWRPYVNVDGRYTEKGTSFLCAQRWVNINPQCTNVGTTGHRRVRACLEMFAEGDERFKELECEGRTFGSENDELRYLIMCNDTRVKTLEQKAREAEGLLEIERAEAGKRMKSGKKSNPLPTLAEGMKKNKKGNSRDIVAQSIGMKSGHELERSLAAVKAIDELTAQNRIFDADLIRKELNNGSASAAEKLELQVV